VTGKRGKKRSRRIDSQIDGAHLQPKRLSSAKIRRSLSGLVTFNIFTTLVASFC
jgi:hypothetical protein